MAEPYAGGRMPPAPEGFDAGAPGADPAAALDQRDHVMREKLVKVAEARLLRDELKECYRMEGVNHYKNCKGLADAYVHTIRNVGVQKYNAGPWDNVAE